MALVFKDRVQETTATTGTGTLTLAGAIPGYQAFSEIGDGNVTYYTIYDTNVGDWEVGVGTYTLSGTTLSRDTVLSSSNSNALVSFGAGTKVVWCDYPAEKAVSYQADGSVVIQGPGATISDSFVLISNPNTSANSSADVYFNAAGQDRAYISGFSPAGGAGNGGGVTIWVKENGGSYRDRLAIDQNGAVTIGDTVGAFGVTVGRTLYVKDEGFINTPEFVIQNKDIGGSPQYAYLRINGTAGDLAFGYPGAGISWEKPIAGSGVTQMVLDGSSQLGVGPNAATPRQRITLGNTTSTATATPESIDMGGTYSNAAGLNAKLKLWYAGTNFFGIGVSGGQLDYSANGSHVWYYNNAGVATELARLTSTGTFSVNGNRASGIVATNVSTGSGTASGITGIPAGVKRIQLIFQSLSVTSTVSPLIQLGTSAGYVATGYVGYVWYNSASGINAAASLTTGQELVNTIAAATISHGMFTVCNIAGTNQWVFDGHIQGTGGVGGGGAGIITLPGTLDRVQLTGATFDGGSVTITYE